MKAVGRGRLAMYIRRKREFTQLGVFFGINGTNGGSRNRQFAIGEGRGEMGHE